MELSLPYLSPPESILKLVEAPLTSSVSLSPNGKILLLFSRPGLASMEEVSMKELRLAGIRFHPQTNSTSSATYFTGIKIKTLGTNESVDVSGLPEITKISNIKWSPDGEHVAFSITEHHGLSLWLLEIGTARVRKLTEAIINNTIGNNPFAWLSDGQRIVYKSIDLERGELQPRNSIPKGPIIQENKGKTKAVRTYQDLLKNEDDKILFRYYTQSQLMVIDIKKNIAHPFGPKAIIKNFSPSPDGNYIFLTRILPPFSYIVPYDRFPFKMEIYDVSGKLIKCVADIPSAESIPIGFGGVRTGPRSFSWRADVPATLHWVEAQDGGDPKANTDIRDRSYLLVAPFDKQAEPCLNFHLRYGGVTWGTGNVAIAYEWQWQNRQIITSYWQPDNPSKKTEILFDHYWEDQYNSPGDFVTTRNENGLYDLLISNGDTLYLLGKGASPKGNCPFIDSFNINTKQTNRLWESKAPFYEYPIAFLDKEGKSILTRRESNEEPPNFFVRKIDEEEIQQVTNFKNPYPSLEGVKRELIQYQRADGVELNGSLYLPAGYQVGVDEPLPVLMWAYPRVYKSKNAAGQITASPYEFIKVHWASPIFWVEMGYAVFDNFGMPVIGVGNEEPNETFREQLIADAEAAVNYLVNSKIADPERIAIGGHSYGAFMTANLLAHTDLFAAGIARSGAYNRTLTPFGFQSEERTFWEAPETYLKMSPFAHADKITSPLLLIHGEADNNAGTYPMQSERFFGALQGQSAYVRLVMFPFESHSYRAKESIMHMLWEMDNWLEKHVKNKEVKKDNNLAPKNL